MNKYFTTVGMHDGFFEMEILVHLSAKDKKESKHIANNHQLGTLYNDRFIFKGEDSLIINREETEKYQFRVCREWKPIVEDKDYDGLTWDEAIKYLVEENGIILPFTLESYYFTTLETHPFVKTV
ncbi:hypothetical protein [Bacillus massiliglaciei]|uniref:hypothetical protein n=1 Tax=Bacillus massiliglaciei TaxID=1816693 RepID=UPI000DA5EE08|nr:hypothetical protein [Bacillus massiliglaciei]